MAGEFLLRDEADTNNPFAPRVYYKGLTAGKTCVYQTNVFGNRTGFISILAQGARFPDDLGCGGAIRVFYAGFEIPEFENGVRNWRFHKGTIPKRPNYKAITGVDTVTNAFTVPNHGYNTGDLVAFHGRGLDVTFPASQYNLTSFHVAQMVYVLDANRFQLLNQSSGAPDTNTAYDFSNAGANLNRLFVYKADAHLFDAEQGRPEIFSALNFSFAGLCYIEVLLPSHLSTGEDEPSNLKVIMYGKEVYEIAVGAGDSLIFNTAIKGAVANNARIAADVLRNDGKLPAKRLNGTTFVAWRDRCDGLISWIGGNDNPANPASFPTNVNQTYDASAVKITKTAGGNDWDSHTVSPQFVNPSVASAEVRHNGGGWAMHFNLANLGEAQKTRQGVRVEDNIMFYQDGAAAFEITPVSVGDKIRISYENKLLVIYKNSVPMPMVQNTYDQRYTSFYVEFMIKTVGTVLDQILIAPSGTNGQPRSVKRFQGGFASNSALPAVEVFEAEIHLSPGTSWADVDGQVKIATEPDRTAAFAFVYDPNNSVASNVAKVTVKQKDLPDLDNYRHILYRDDDDIILSPKFVSVDRKERRASNGGKLVNSGNKTYGVMSQSHAERLGETGMRLDSDLDVGFTVEAFLDSIEVVKGSFVTLAAPEIGYSVANPAKCIVHDTRLSPNDVETLIYELQLITPDFYSDTAHGAVTPVGSVNNAAAFAPPQTARDMTLIETLEPTPDGGYLSRIKGTAEFGAGTQQRGRLFTKTLTERLNTVTFNAATDVFTTAANEAPPLNTTPLSVVSVGGSAPAELDVDIPYYAVNIAGNTFKVSRTINGAAENLTTNGTGELRIYRYEPFVDSNIDIYPNANKQGAFEIFPARKGVTLARIQTLSAADVSLPLHLHYYEQVAVQGDIAPPAAPATARYSYDGALLTTEWSASETPTVNKYLITDGIGRYLEETKDLRRVETPNADNVTRRIYAVNSSGILSSGYAQVTFIRPDDLNWYNETGGTVNSSKAFTKTAGTAWENSGATLNQKIISDIVLARLSVTPNQANKFQVVGFNNTKAINGISDFVYALYFRADGFVEARQNNSGIATLLGEYSIGEEYILEINPTFSGKIARVFSVDWSSGSRVETLRHTFASTAEYTAYFAGIALYEFGDSWTSRIEVSGDLFPAETATPFPAPNLYKTASLDLYAKVGVNRVTDIPKFVAKATAANEVLAIVNNEQVVKRIRTTLAQFLNDAPNVGGGETDLFAYAVPANTLTQDGDSIEAKFVMTLHAPSAKNFRAYFAGVPILITEDIVQASGGVEINVFVIRLSSTLIRTIARINSTSTNDVQYAQLLPITAIDSHVLKLTGQGENNNEIYGRFAQVWFNPKA